MRLSIKGADSAEASSQGTASQVEHGHPCEKRRLPRLLAQFDTKSAVVIPETWRLVQEDSGYCSSKPRGGGGGQ